MSSAADGAWRPILEAPASAEALRVVQEVLRATTPEHAREAGPSLADGWAGMALLHGYAARSGAFPAGDETVAAHLDELARALGDTPLPPSLFSGVAGVSWTLQHLWLLGGDADEDDDDALSEIDEALLGHVSQTPWRHSYDLVSGLVGFGVYALERLPRARAKASVGEIVARLEELGLPQAAGVAWPTGPELLPAWQRARCPEGYRNAGVAHGVPGVVWFLAHAARAGILPERARALSLAGARWLLAQRGPTPGRALPSWVSSGGADGPARSAWCYGDPGAAVALLSAARLLGDGVLEAEVVTMAQAAARLTLSEALVVDPGICHGAAGLAHVYNRLHQATGQETFRDAAVRFLEGALALRRPGQPQAGYWREEVPERGSAGTAVPDGGFLTGAAGVALVLLAAATALEPSWDTALLARVPPRPGPTTPG